MSTTKNGSVENLVSILARYSGTGAKPYVLFLGAGVSIPSGLPSGTGLVDAVLNDSGYGSQIEDDKHRQEVRWSRFQAVWDNLGREGQETTLRKLLTSSRENSGLKCLAELIRDGYFDFVLSTNIDQLLEQHVIRAGVPQDQFVVTVASVMRPEIIGDVLTRKFGKHLLKLHGDLAHREWAFSPRELYRFTGSLQTRLEDFLKDRDVILVGHSLHDEDVLEWLSFPTSLPGHTLWYVNRDPIPEHISKLLSRQRIVNEVVSPAGDSERFFCELRDGISRLAEPDILDFSAPPPSPLRLVNGVADYFGEGSYGLGSPERGVPETNGVALWRTAAPVEYDVTAEFKIVNPGPDDTGWVGILVKASGPYLSGGWLCYLRTSGSLEILPREGSPEFVATPARPAERPVQMVVRARHGEVVVELPEFSSLVKMSIGPLQDFLSGQVVALHTFGVNARFTRLELKAS